MVLRIHLQKMPGFAYFGFIAWRQYKKYGKIDKNQIEKYIAKYKEENRKIDRKQIKIDRKKKENRSKNEPTPRKQTNSSLHTVLFCLSREGGHCVP